MAGAIVTRTARYAMDDDGIVRLSYLPGAQETLPDVQNNLRALASLVSDGRRCPVLADLRQLQTVDRAARAYYAGPEFARVVSAVAAVTGSPATRMLINFILALHKPRFPVRMFTDEAEALAWIKGLRLEH